MGAGVIPNIRRPFTATAVVATGADGLWAQSDAGTAASGLRFRSDGGTGLYAPIANIIRTDDALQFESAAGTTAKLLAFVTAEGVNRVQMDASGRFDWSSGAAAADTTLQRGGIGVLASSRRATTVSGSAEAIATAGTITLATGVGTVRLNPTGNVTGVIMPAGTVDGEKVALANESAFTITFAAVGTSRVRDGTSCVIAANRGAEFSWVAATTTWTRTD